ncbi:MAG: hypothetical protein KF678_07640 [Phycisphaeraceae bacterium]|nr:hypothetical protein [Phycisphaeraceae bacterium]
MKTDRSHHRGTVYLSVIATAAVVTTLGLTGLALVQAQRRRDQAVVDMLDARAAAVVGLDWARNVVASTPLWRKRTASTAGVLAERTLGRAKVQVKLLDPADGDLSNSDLDPVEVTSVGYIGSVTPGGQGAVQIFSQTLLPRAVPVSSLAAAVAVGGAVQIDKGVIGGYGLVAANGNITASGAKVRSRVRSGGSVSGGTYSGGQTSGATAMVMPAGDLFDWYTAAGTEIMYASLSGGRLERLVLSSSSNPYKKSATDVNARGIYWIDCEGKTIEIQNCRIVGTLVVLNAGAASKVAGSVTWEPAEANLPALLVKGPMNFDTRLKPLSEAEWSTNFNPAGTPYANVSNTSVTDVYPSMINGLVFVSQAARVDGELMVDGAVVVGMNLTVAGTLMGVYSDRVWYDPPPGFASSYVMVPKSGSFRQVVR